MKRIVSDNGNYQVSMEIVPDYNGQHCLRFLSQFQGSRSPDSEQVKLELFLSREELKTMASSIISEVQAV